MKITLKHAKLAFKVILIQAVRWLMKHSMTKRKFFRYSKNELIKLLFQRRIQIRMAGRILGETCKQREK